MKTELVFIFALKQYYTMPESKITGRVATEKDQPELTAMMEDFFLMFGYPFDRALRNKQVLEVIGSPAFGQLLLFEINTQIIGYMLLSNSYSFEFGGKIGYIDEFYLKPDFRGLGAGRQILDLLKTQLEETGFKSLRLEVENYNKQAIRLYEKSGFSIHSTRHLMTYMPSLKSETDEHDPPE